ncbi:hypothetical protein ACF0H5_002565 [Mactra antiquata]
MAEGGSFSNDSDEADNASGDADEVFCDPCKNKPQWIAVMGYCIVCKEYLCYNCLEVHRNQRITKGHHILDKDEMPKGHASSSNQVPCAEICEEHTPELVRYYCVDHAVTGCGDCMTLSHASCQKKRVQDIATGFTTSAEFNQLLPKFVQFLEDLESMKDTLDNKLGNIGTRYSALMQTIADFRQGVNDHLDQIQTQLEDEVTSLRDTQEQELNRLIASNESMMRKIKTTLQKIEVFSSDVNENSTFVVSKQAKREMTRMENELKSIEVMQEQQQYEFCPSPQVADLVRVCISFGKLLKLPGLQSTVLYRRSFTVKTESGRSDCKINDCVLLTPGRMVATDGNNKTVKLLDMKNKRVLSAHGVNGEPYGITKTDTDQVAVILPAEKNIEVLKVKHEFSSIRTIKVKRDCCGISYKDNKFAVSYSFPGGVEILDTRGNILHTIEPMEGTEPMLQAPTFISFGTEDNTVLLSDNYTNKVSVVSFEGKVLRSCNLNCPRGIAMTQDGVVFVCCWADGCINVVTPDLKIKKIIIKEQNDQYKHVKMPHTIAYCGVYHKLYVTNSMMGTVCDNNMHEYKMNI